MIYHMLSWITLFAPLVMYASGAITTILDIPALPPLGIKPMYPSPHAPPSPPHASLSCYATDMRPFYANMAGTFHTYVTPRPFTTCIKSRIQALVRHPVKPDVIGTLEGVYLNGISDLRILANVSVCEELVRSALERVNWEGHVGILVARFDNVTCCTTELCNKDSESTGYTINYSIMENDGEPHNMLSIGMLWIGAAIAIAFAV
jgi:hypothetical protein